MLINADQIGKGKQDIIQSNNGTDYIGATNAIGPTNSDDGTGYFGAQLITVELLEGGAIDDAHRNKNGTNFVDATHQMMVRLIIYITTMEKLALVMMDNSASYSVATITNTTMR